MECCQNLGKIATVIEPQQSRTERSDLRQIIAATLRCSGCAQFTMGGHLVVYAASGQIVFYLPAWKVENLRTSAGRKTFREHVLIPLLQAAPFNNWADSSWQTFTFEFELVKQSKWAKIWQQEQLARAHSPEALSQLDWHAIETQLRRLDATATEGLIEGSLSCLTIWLAKEIRLHKETVWPDPTQLELTAQDILRYLQESDAARLRQSDSPELAVLLQNLAIYFSREVRRLYAGRKLPDADQLNDMFSELCRVKLLQILHNARQLAELDPATAQTLRLSLVSGQIKPSVYQYYYSIPLRVALCSNLMIENFIKNLRSKAAQQPVSLSLDQPVFNAEAENQVLGDFLADPLAQAELEAVLEANGDLAHPPEQLSEQQQTFFLQIAGPWLAQLLNAILQLEGQRSLVILARMRMSGFSQSFFELIENEFGLSGLIAALPRGAIPANPLSLELLLDCSGANQVYNTAIKLLDQKFADAQPQLKRTLEALKEVLALRTEAKSSAIVAEPSQVS